MSNQISMHSTFYVLLWPSRLLLFDENAPSFSHICPWDWLWGTKSSAWDRICHAPSDVLAVNRWPQNSPFFRQKWVEISKQNTNLSRGKCVVEGWLPISKLTVRLRPHARFAKDIHNQSSISFSFVHGRTKSGMALSFFRATRPLTVADLEIPQWLMFQS